jgi:hypothetical protein
MPCQETQETQSDKHLQALSSFENAIGSQWLRLRSASTGSTSALALKPVKRNNDDFVSLFLEDKRTYLRTHKRKQIDFGGAKNGSRTAFIATAAPDGSLLLQGNDSGKWLSVVDGHFVSTDKPEALLIEVTVDNDALPKPEFIGSATGALATFQQAICSQWLRFRSAATNSSSVAALKPVKRNKDDFVSLFLEEKRHLRTHKRGKTDLNGWKNGPATAFIATAGPDGSMFLRGNQSGKWLSVTAGQFVCGDEPEPLFVELAAQAPTAQEREGYRTGAGLEGDYNMLPTEMPEVDTSILSAQDIAHFRREGYIIIKNAIPAPLIKTAMRSINYQLGQPSCWQVDDDALNANTQIKLSVHDSVSGNIFNRSPKFWSAVSVLLGSGNVAPWKRGAQVALRFPQPPEKGFDVPDAKPGTQYHIDGMGQNRLCPFSLLCGVALSDQSRPSMGNLHVFPRSHLHEGLRKYYKDQINDDEQDEQDERKPDLGDSVQVLLEPGDVVIAHQLLGHRVGVNTSESIRYQLYYRVKHQCHEDYKEQIIDDPWVEFAV